MLGKKSKGDANGRISKVYHFISNDILKGGTMLYEGSSGETQLNSSLKVDG